MARKKIRDAAYYKARLRKEHPAIYADLLAARYPSVRKAAAAAGLIRLPTRFDALKREWRRASRGEQADFLKWLRTVIPKKAKGLLEVVDSDNRLKPAVAKFLASWLLARKAKPGSIMKELGFSNFDYRLSPAIFRGEQLPQEIVDKLGPWLLKNGYFR